MHEFGITEHIIEEIIRHLDGHRPGRAAAIRLRHGIDVVPEALQQAFAVLSRGTALENARLVLEEKTPSCSCACGNSRPLRREDVVGHVYVCPACAAVHEIPGTHGIEVVDIEWIPAPAEAGAAAPRP